MENINQIQSEYKNWYQLVKSINKLAVIVKQYLVISVSILFIFISNCKGQTEILPAGKYLLGDTIIEVKYFSDLNSIREFKKIEGTNIEYYRNYYMDS